MKSWPLLFLLVAVCCLSAGCAARNRGDGSSNTSGANAGANGNNAAATATKPSKDDVAFAKDAVEGLLDGDTSVADAFDWENLKVPGADAGDAYKDLPDDENRVEFQKGFIEKFSQSFKASGASVNDLTNWREQSKDGETTIVAVDTVTGKTMRVFVVHSDGRQQVSELSIK
ncbi:MAG TPA: hypothetical protein VJ842_05780 [Pyrinomonadaceae bacterium]|nr:hypothetical protein [Pyrinomonadaceae bacterium]